MPFISDIVVPTSSDSGKGLDLIWPIHCERINGMLIASQDLMKSCVLLPSFSEPCHHSGHRPGLPFGILIPFFPQLKSLLRSLFLSY